MKAIFETTAQLEITLDDADAQKVIAYSQGTGCTLEDAVMELFEAGQLPHLFDGGVETGSSIGDIMTVEI